MRKMLMMLMMIGSLSAQYEVVKKENPITDADFTSKTAKGFSVVEFCAGWAGVCSIDKFMGIEGYKGTKIFHAETKDTPRETRRNKLRTFPSVVLYKDGKPIKKWKATIDGKNAVTEIDIKMDIDFPPINKRRRSTSNAKPNS
tara:strand:+ start:112 stop:540 length:429 start_codon:yes stop_codon:yes gene_type:complete